MDEDALDAKAKELMDAVNTEYKKIVSTRQFTRVSAPEIMAQIIFWVSTFESFGLNTPVETLVDLGKTAAIQMKQQTVIEYDDSEYKH